MALGKYGSQTRPSGWTNIQQYIQSNVPAAEERVKKIGALFESKLGNTQLEGDYQKAARVFPIF